MKKAIRLFFIPLFCLMCFSADGENEKSLSLSLEDCILKTIKNNLGVAVAVLEPELAELSVSLARERFMPQLALDFSKSDQNQASYSWLDASEQLSTSLNEYSAQINQIIPTGGNFTLSLQSSMYDTNRRFQTINPSYRSALRFDFSQPLLKNFGLKTNRKEILIAQNNKEISEMELKKSLQDTIYRVEEAYWNLVYSIELLKVRRQSLKLARDLLEKNKRAVEIGTLAPIEILSAEASVASREADILDTELAVKNNEDILKTIINLSAELEGADYIRVIPSDIPDSEEKEISVEQALLSALNNRPELQSLKREIATRELNLSYARNQVWPELTLRASYWSPGISGDRILYLNDNPLSGIIVGTLAGGISESLKDALNFKYKNWSLGLTLNIPLSSLTSRAQLAQAKVNLEQTLLRLKNQEQQIFLEIKTAVRDVQTNYKRVQAYRVARELAEKKLEAEEEKLKIGLSTNFFVLQYQTDLANAQSQELKAIIDYNLSLARLKKAMGVSLEERKIKVSEILTR